MAKKVNALQLALQNWGHAEVTNRWPAPASPALYGLPLRWPKPRISPLKKKLPIAVDDETRAQIEHPVKIRHVA